MLHVNQSAILNYVKRSRSLIHALCHVIIFILLPYLNLTLNSRDNYNSDSFRQTNVRAREKKEPNEIRRVKNLWHVLHIHR